MKKENGDFWIKRLIQEEVFYSPEKALQLSKDRSLNEKNKFYHTKQESFNKDMFKRKYEKKITFNDLPKIFNDKVLNIKYDIPTSLLNMIEKTIKFEFFNDYQSSDKRKQRKYQTKLEQAIYFCLAILHFNEKKNLELKKFKEHLLHHYIELIIYMM